ncbi:tannase and feruloyl esterase-domain-containing protein [Mycena rosella]|uniref:Carboxylic ester hydrolase n=1 Tax=Mycena rosella TaxID=1033263 RepID=A0AAD7DN15_MYCRO|nr:tannase and feruloyl esterase-domain-containing protein [Mycena rosella]
MEAAEAAEVEEISIPGHSGFKYCTSLLYLQCRASQPSIPDSWYTFHGTAGSGWRVMEAAEAAEIQPHPRKHDDSGCLLCLCGLEGEAPWDLCPEGACISYRELDYGSALYFTTVASNNGHDSDTGRPFLGNKEALNDFAVIGKQIVAEYYGRPHAKSYYVKCLTGGRQRTQTALRYPEDFDGIIASAPTTDFNRLLHWTGMLARYISMPSPDSTPVFITPDLWKVVAQEILHQCNGIDGVVDGIITEPDACKFRPEVLMFQGDSNGRGTAQNILPALRQWGADLPRFDPGSEGIYIGGATLSRKFPAYTTAPYTIFFSLLRELNLSQDWRKYTVLNTSEFDFSECGLHQGRLMDEVNPGGIATFDGDFSLIASGNSKRMYDLIVRTLNMASLDVFYRLFLMLGMGHCSGGPGAACFGQLGGQNVVNASVHNMLLVLVNWVEGGVAPDTIIGTKEGGATHVHCWYPQQSVWDGSAYVCEE